LFTGLIEAVGRIEAREPIGGDLRLRLACPPSLLVGVGLGDSIAVSGCCLTVVELAADEWAADVSNETLRLTTLGSKAIGSAVNFERAMLPTTRLGGHLVAGHVDGVGEVASIRDDGRAQRWRFAAPPALLRYVAVKGSVCVDGVSLTVNAADAQGFEVALIPHTLAHTAFAETPIGAPVNLEVDLLARYVERLLETRSWPLNLS